MRSNAYLALVVVVAFASWVGYTIGDKKAEPDDSELLTHSIPVKQDEGIHAEPTVSRMVSTAQAACDSKTQSLLQEQLNVMREQLADTNVMLSNLQVMSSACETPNSVKTAEGESHEPIQNGQ